MKLNLASGTDIRDGWINLDVVPRWPLAKRECDVVWDARKDKIPFPDGSATEIYCGYLLLHLAPCWHPSVLSDIYRVLASDGVVIFDEVDMEIVFRRFLENPLDSNNNQLIWGEQGNIHGNALMEFDKHCWGFTESSLKITLEDAGFCVLERFNQHNCYYDLAFRCTKVNK